ncbi:MAG: ABC transporter permease [Candidatus Sumerlaeota bacterium]
MNFSIPPIPLGDWIEGIIDWLVKTFSGLTNFISQTFDASFGGASELLLRIPPWGSIVVFAAVAFGITRKRKLTVLSALGLGLIWNLGLWEPMVNTFVLVIIATIISIVIGIPMGILAALSTSVHRILMPILDFMQTLPAFVYLLPAIFFFGLGATPAIFATVIFSAPPVIRLTVLGIDQVPEDLIEAADAFGSTWFQKLIKVQIPMSMPSIKAGVNQTVLLALSMVVIAAMIGAPGLGSEVWRAIQRLNTGMGFEAGIAIVILAMILDRLLQNLGGGDMKDAQSK